MDRTGETVAPAEGCRHRSVGHGEKVADLAVAAVGGGDVDVVPHRPAEEADLVGGLGGTGAPELVRAVGGQQDQRDARVVRLEDGGVQVRDGGARGGDDGDRGDRIRALGQAEREEARRPLVDTDVQADRAVVRCGSERVRERRRP